MIDLGGHGWGEWTTGVIVWRRRGTPHNQPIQQAPPLHCTRYKSCIHPCMSIITEEEVVDEAEEDGQVVRGNLGRVEVPVGLFCSSGGMVGLVGWIAAHD